MDETDRAAALIKDACAADANIIYGTAIVPSLQDDMQVTIIATGFNKPTNARPPQPQPQGDAIYLYCRYSIVNSLLLLFSVVQSGEPRAVRLVVETYKSAA